MRRRLMMGQGVDTIPGKHSAVAGDILCANSDGSKMVVPASDYASIPSGYEAIGIVVIPPSHDVYGTGEGAAVSLKWMSRNTPDDGATSSESICWGQLNVDTSLTNFNQANTTDNASNPTISFSDRACFPSDNFTGEQCVTDPIAYYDIWTPYAPSPYLSDGSRNKDYYTTKYTVYNAFSDFDGIGNTNVLCSLATAQSDWRTASKITDNGNRGYSPAACCCWRFHTVGTNQGDWYLPAAGELGYLIVRLKTIDASISNVGGALVYTRYYFWTSSEDTNYYARIIGDDDGLLAEETKSNHVYVRSFIHF